jgi:hypothetical protein
MTAQHEIKIIGLAIEKITGALEILDASSCSRREQIERSLSEAADGLRSISGKHRPRWETPEQYQARTGEPWGERDAVYFVDYTDTDEGGTDQRFWRVGTLGGIKKIVDDINDGGVLCATTHCPPDDCVRQAKE